VKNQEKLPSPKRILHCLFIARFYGVDGNVLLFGQS